MALYENDYNRRLANNLSQINYSLSKKDNLTDVVGMKGGAVSRMRSNDEKNMYVQDLASVGDKYIMSGSSANYPMLNMSELQRLDKERKNPLYYQKLTNSQLKGGISWNDVGNFFKPIGSAILDVAAPAAGMFMGGPAGAMGATAIRQGIKGATGVGLKKGKMGGAKTAGVGTYKIAGKLSQEQKDARIAIKQSKQEQKKAEKDARKAVKQAEKDARMAVKQAQKEAKIAIKQSKQSQKQDNKPKRKASSSVNKRAEIVKQIMKDMNLKMVDASKYVKEKGLYQK